VNATDAPVLEVEDAAIRFTVSAGWFARRHIDAVDGVDLKLYPEELVALVGESGSGKTTLARTLAGLQKLAGGSVRYRGVELNNRNRKQMREFRKRRAIVFQNPYQSLNPRMRVDSTLREALKVAGVVDAAAISREVDRLLVSVGLPTSYRQKYPLALSGGERQRVAIARAIAAQPDVLIADEVTSALDVSVSAHIVNLLLDLQAEAKFACLLITHDLSLAMAVADRIVIMRDGHVVDEGAPAEMRRSSNDYTRELLDLAALPQLATAE
jgi:peptide/nickel transport system ATP-binding protein